MTHFLKPVMRLLRKKLRSRVGKEGSDTKVEKANREKFEKKQQI